MKIKRLLSFILSLVLVFGVISAPGFAAEEEAEVIYGIESIQILKALNITELAEEELGDSITRAEFLKMIGVLAGYGEIKSTEQLFKDLPVDNEYEPYLRALYNMGVIAPDASGNINPSTEIVLSEAAAIAVKVTGYSLVAEAKGGYPLGYVNVAKNNGILRGLPDSPYTVMTKGMAAKLAENTLKADIMVQTGFGSDVFYEEQENKNLLYSIYRTRYIEDVLEGVDISRIVGENDVNTFYIEIAGKEIKAQTIKNIYDYLGYRVGVYYSEERGDIPRVLSIVKSEKNTETVIDIDDITDVSLTRVKAYNEKNKIVSYSIKKGIPVIYNGVATRKNFTMSLISGKSGKIRLVDNSTDKTPDVIFVDAYDTYVVSQVVSKEFTVYDRYGKKLVLDITKNDPYTVIYDAEGKEINIAKIKSGNVLAVFDSAPDAYQGYRNAYLVDESVSGVIEATKDNLKKVIIDGEEYKVTPECKTKFINILKPGQMVTLKLDFDGKAVWVERAEDAAYEYGYLVATDNGGGLRGNVSFKIYTLKDMFEIFPAAERLLIDGKKYNADESVNIYNVLHKAADEMHAVRDASGAITTHVDPSCISSIIKYVVNGDGEITAIDTILNYNDGANTLAKREDLNVNSNDSVFSLMFDSQIAAQRYISGNLTIGKQVAFTKTSLVFFYPRPIATGAEGDTADNVNDEDNYRIGIAEDFLVHNSNYSGCAFYDNSNEYLSEFIGVQIDDYEPDISYELMFAVIDEVYDAYDQEKDEIVSCVKISTSSGTVELFAKKGDGIVTAVDNEGAGLSATMDVSGLKKGDVVAYAALEGYLKQVHLYFRADGKYMGTTSGVSTEPTANRAHRFGFVYEKFGGGMLVYFVDNVAALNNKSVLDTIKAENCEIVTDTGAQTVYYSYEEGRPGEMVVETISKNSLRSYKDTGLDCSKIYIQQSKREPMAILTFE